MKKLTSLLLSLLCGVGMAFAGDSIPLTHSNLDYIDPTIGNVGQLLEPTRPTIQLPYQFIRMTPQRRDYTDDQISSFPLTVVSHRMGEVFSIMPSLAAIGPEAWKHPFAYDHELEINRPWYYSTWLTEEEIGVEFVPGAKTGYYRFHFPGTRPPALLLDVYNEGASNWTFGKDNELTGMETWHGDVKVYMYGRFSGTAETGIPTGSTKAWIQWPASVRDVEFRYAISYVSPEQARKNFEKELHDKPFITLREEAQKAWTKVFSQVHTEGGSLAQKRAFYTALYRCYERMVNISEDSLYYSGYDKKIHTDSHPFYVDDWSWDTYLALHPLRMILQPAIETDMLRSYIRMYEQGGWMPTFPLLYGDHPCMNGFHSSVIFLDAWRKNLRNWDVDSAYQGMRKNATDATMLPWRNGPKTRLDDFYQANGFYPALRPGEKETVSEVDGFERRQAVAITLGTCYDDWALSELAGELGKKQDQQHFAARAENYHNLWDNQTQFFLPKDSTGNWIRIDPGWDGGPGGRDYYDENNGYTYLWQVQENIPALIKLMGGQQSFEARLDQLYREGLGREKIKFWNKFGDASGLTGQFSMGNEPSFHIPYLYNFTASPWKTQQRVRYLLNMWFRDDVFGIPGDEDGGGMSAFVVFSSMGFYPLTPGMPRYTIGSPVFDKVQLSLPNGKKFTIIARNNSAVNKYIQRATLNGKPLDSPWFSHAQLEEGATLELVMGPKPNKTLW